MTEDEKVRDILMDMSATQLVAVMTLTTENLEQAANQLAVKFLEFTKDLSKALEQYKEKN